MEYKKPEEPSLLSPLPAVSGSGFGSVFRPWQPSTWPEPPAKFDAAFVDTLSKVFDESILGEISNVIEDILERNGDLQQRGHVVAIALMCALDATSSYGYRGKRGKHMIKFVKNHFPEHYKRHAKAIYTLYRNSLVHSWNLFEVAIHPGNEPIQKANGVLSFGLLNFFDALKTALKDFLAKLATDAELQAGAMERYQHLKESAKAYKSEFDSG